MQQPRKATTEIVPLLARLFDGEPDISLQIRPSRAPLRPIEIVNFNGLFSQEDSQTDVRPPSQGHIGTQLGLQSTPIVLLDLTEAPENLIPCLALKLNMAARRQRAKSIFDRICELTAREPRNRQQEPVKPEILTVAPNKIEHEAAFLPLRQTKSASKLLLKEDRTLGWSQQQQGVDCRNIHPFVEEVTGHQRLQVASSQTLRSPPALVRWRCTHNAHRLDTRLIEAGRHEFRVCYRNAEYQGPTFRDVVGKTPPLVDHQTGSDVVSRY